MAEDGSEVATAVVPSLFFPYSRHWPESLNDSKCSYCGIKKVVAESRLHRGWSCERQVHRAIDAPFEAFRAGTTLGCNLCALVVDAVTACRPEGLQGLETAELVDLCIYNGSSYCTLDIISYGPTLSVFMAEGMDAHPAQSYLVLRVLGMMLDRTADKHVDIDSETTWNLRTLPHPSGDTSSLQAVNTIQRWISTCKKDHRHCRSHDQSYQSPRRILKLSPLSVQLCEHMDSERQYACLSHCWGPKGPALRLGYDTIAKLKHGIPVDELPKTFRDAVVLCLSLNLQYLWIDALCILQDNADDWKETAATMADIYAGAMITIAATWSDDSDHGCFSQMRTEYEDKPLQEQGVFVRVKKPLFPRRSWNSSDADESWPLLDRAWVYQERKLSACVVHLAKEQLYWECNSALLSEDGSLDIDQTRGIDLRSPIEDPADAWRMAVEHYSGLKLTHESDRLPAISALVKRMQPLRDDDIYIAGIWLNTILIDITWQISLDEGLLPRRESTFPTWSWVAVPHGVRWVPGSTLLPSARLLDISYNIIGPTNFGQTTDASIRIEGPTMAVKYEEERNTFRITNIHGPYEDSEDREAFVSPDFDLKSADPPIFPGEIFDILLMSVKEKFWYGSIVLRKTAEERYQRVGWTEVSHHQITRTDNYPEWTDPQVLKDFVASLPIKQFTIV